MARGWMNSGGHSGSSREASRIAIVVVVVLSSRPPVAAVKPSVRVGREHRNSCRGLNPKGKELHRTMLRSLSQQIKTRN